jgi:hypothetical protein
MMRTLVPSEIGFADGEVLNYSREGSEFKVMVKAWNDAVVKISFTNAIGICRLRRGEYLKLLCKTDPLILNKN